MTVGAIKRLQAQRFRATYADLLASSSHGPAARFFLEELYGDRDFSERDAQFGQIAGAIEKLFPEAVGELAVDLAETHSLTESLDHGMAERWPSRKGNQSSQIRADRDAASLSRDYVLAWRAVGERALRLRQLAVVMHMGTELQSLTRKRSLRMALRMMRAPAQAAGLGDLQQFLERGFDAFAQMHDPSGFLQCIQERESTWIDLLFDGDSNEVALRLAHELSAVSHESPPV